MTRIQVVTFQVGCANNILPVVRRLIDLGAEVQTLCSGGAVEVFKNGGLDFREVDVELTRREIEKIFNDFEPDMLITGSNAVNKLEFNFRVEAKSRNIPSITFLDFWSKYRERFFDTDSGLDSVPDIVIAVDDYAKKGLVGAGIDRSRIKVTGSPYFEKLNAKYSVKTRSDSQKLAGNILFCSQPISELYGKDESEKPYLGYDEFTTFENIYHLFSGAKDFEVIVKLHPRERREEWEAHLSMYNRLDNYRIEFNRDTESLIWEADILLGMITNTLIEAAVMGKPSLSLQIGSNGRFEFFGTVSGIVPTVTSFEAFERYLKDFLSGGNVHMERDVSYLYKDATEKCIACIMDLQGARK